MKLQAGRIQDIAWKRHIQRQNAEAHAYRSGNEQTADKGLYPQNDAAQDNEMTRRVTSLYALH